MNTSRSRIDRARDQLAVALSNWVINHLATQCYRDTLNGLIELGIDSVAKQCDPYGLRATDKAIDKYDGPRLPKSF